MDGWGALLAVVLVAIGTVPAVRHQWRTDRAATIRTLLVMALFVAFAMAGGALLTLLVPVEGTGDDAAATLLLLGLLMLWLLYGGLWLVRLLPKYRRVSGWMKPGFGAIDIALLGPFALLLLALIL